MQETTRVKNIHWSIYKMWYISQTNVPIKNQNLSESRMSQLQASKLWFNIYSDVEW